MQGQKRQPSECHFGQPATKLCCDVTIFDVTSAHKALSSRPPLETEHCYSRPPQLARETPTQLLDHTYAGRPDVAPLPQRDMGYSFTMKAKYADDITNASTYKSEIDQTKATVHGQLNVSNIYHMQMKQKPEE